jgi:dynein heavy chain, axonemal
LKNSLERIVTKWAGLIDEVLKETSASLFEHDNHPTPLAELKFWNDRRKNVKNIYSQLLDPRVQTIGSILELIQSVYSRTFMDTVKSIVISLDEVNDITMYLNALVRIP